MKQYFNTTNIIQLVILLLLTLAIFLPITLTEIAFHDITDYPTYLEDVENISVNPKYWSNVTSNPLWVAMVLAVKNLFSIRPWKAALIVQLVNQGFLALILFYLVKQASPERNSYIPIILPLGIMIAAPFFLIAFKDQQFYNGYLGINSYHNPTIFALKPYALVFFLISSIAIANEWIPANKMIFGLFAAILSSLMKPSFTICLLPAVGLFYLASFINKKALDRKAILLYIFLPSILVLAYEYFSTYTSGDVSVEFLPLVVMRNSSNFLLFKFVLSIWFPLIVLINYWKSAMADMPLKLAWATFFFGASYSYLLAEGGWRIFHGNFTWSGEISLFVLFTVSAIFFFSQMEKTFSKTKWTITLLVGFMPHIVCGFVYYAYCLLNNIYA